MHQSPKIRTTKIVYPQVYSYTLPEFIENEGSQKIGYTEYKDVDKRIYAKIKDWSNGKVIKFVDILDQD